MMLNRAPPGNSPGELRWCSLRSRQSGPPYLWVRAATDVLRTSGDHHNHRRLADVPATDHATTLLVRRWEAATPAASQKAGVEGMP